MSTPVSQRRRPQAKTATKPGTAGRARTDDTAARRGDGNNPRSHGRRRAQRRQTKRKRRVKRIAFVAFVAFVLLLGAGITAFYYLSKIPLPEAAPQNSTTFIYAADGELLAESFVDENRIPIPFEAEGDGYDYSDLPEHLIQAVVAREDRRFFEHSGVDFAGIARAAWNDVRNKPIQGGSTIPQQYVKNALLTNERSLTRKLKEATLAIKLSRQYSKEEIMSLYLNTIYFGRGAYGIEAAAQEYFGKSARDLDMNESAYFAGIISRPATADPIEDQAEAIKRRDLAIDAMTETGFVEPDAAAQEKFMTDDAGVAQPRPVVAIEKQDAATSLAAGGSGYFIDYVEKKATEIVGEQRYQTGGLKIETTLDPTIQADAEEAASDVLDRSGDPSYGVVTLDREGRVRAMVGGRDYAQSQVNTAVGEESGGGGRQPGSTFKPIVLATALQEGMSPSKRYKAPRSITLDDNGTPWKVSNAGDSSGGGSMSLLQATVGSVNTVYAQLVMDVGVGDTVDMAKALGMRSSSLDSQGPAIVLGTAESSPLDMASVYNTFLNEGERVETSVIERIEDAGGQVIYERPKTRERVLDANVANNVTAALRNVISSGTGKAARISGVQTAGKTGTTQGLGDAWFVGYTPEYVTAVWVGYLEGNSKKLTNVHGRRVYGGTFPAQIWQRLMSEIMSDVEDPGKFPKAPTIKAPSSESSTRKPSGSTTSTTEPSSDSSTTSPPSTGADPGDGGGDNGSDPGDGGGTTSPPSTGTDPGDGGGSDPGDGGG